MIVALIGYIAFRHFLQFSRRQMIHRERLAAIEKGVDLPPLEQEVRRSSFNVQRFLLLAGLIWVSLGVGAFAVLSSLLAYHSESVEHLPQGIQWILALVRLVSASLAPGGVSGRKEQGEVVRRENEERRRKYLNL